MTAPVVVVHPSSDAADGYDLGGLDATHVRDPADVDAAVECVLLPARDGWPEAVATLRERVPAVPVLLVGEAGPADAARASRLGVEYAAEDALAATGETLAERVAAALDAPSAVSDGRDRGALRDLHEIATLDTDLASKLDELLRVGCTYLGLDVGVSAEFADDGDDLRVNAAVGEAAPLVGQSLDPDSRFAAALDGDGVVVSGDAPPDAAGLCSSIGATVRVEGEPFGLLCFASAEPRPGGYTEAEREFVELLVSWTGYELDRAAAEREVRAARNEVRRTLDRIGDGFVGLDADWELTYLNDGGREVVAAAGCDDGRFEGRRLWDVAPRSRTRASRDGSARRSTPGRR
ncbi:GAF domain-containing protein [Halosegnis marinus]|uniref:GAF domain-containing protein n=1 Tax=Halosegnis marinus TaxID=3034023 RepID=A0ABD5ZJN1_9EURY|nr:GAF domain-containing protein [Halosegnis sp. DT85]